MMGLLVDIKIIKISSRHPIQASVPLLLTLLNNLNSLKSEEKSPSSSIRTIKRSLRVCNADTFLFFPPEWVNGARPFKVSTFFSSRTAADSLFCTRSHTHLAISSASLFWGREDIVRGKFQLKVGIRITEYL